MAEATLQLRARQRCDLSLRAGWAGWPASRRKNDRRRRWKRKRKRASPGALDRDPADSEDQAWGSHLANASLFVPSRWGEATVGRTWKGGKDMWESSLAVRYWSMPPCVCCLPCGVTIRQMSEGAASEIAIAW